MGKKLRVSFAAARAVLVGGREMLTQEVGQRFLSQIPEFQREAVAFVSLIRSVGTWNPLRKPGKKIPRLRRVRLDTLSGKYSPGIELHWMD